jgi:hypothetical protein
VVESFSERTEAAIEEELRARGLDPKDVVQRVREEDDEKDP